MSVQNGPEIKEKIISILKRRGPSLPVHISKETGLSILFAAAFLSELISDKIVRYSDMKIGSSPLYYLNEHEHMLEKFGQSLKNKEKDAFNLLKERKFLKDMEQSPQIRVALRAIKDFAVPFDKDGQIIWRYYLIPETEFKQEVNDEFVKPELIEIPSKTEEEQQVKPEIQIIKIEESIVEVPVEKSVEIRLEKPIQTQIEKLKEKKKEGKKRLDMLDKPKKAVSKKVGKKKKEKIDDNFFNKVKEWVTNNSMEIIDIYNFNKNELYLKIKRNGKDHLLAAYNKKRVNDSDLIKANKKARELDSEYSILSFGEPQKKISDMIDAAKNLCEIKKMNQKNQQ